MSETNKVKLDKKDKAILRELEHDSRLSYAEIGKRIGLRGETVEYRVHRLQQLGFISRLFMEPNLSRLGLRTYRLYLKVENLRDKEEQEFISTYAAYPYAQWFAEFEGEWDYTIRFTLKNEQQLRDEIEKLMSRFGKYIKSKSMVITIYQTYLPTTYITGSEREPRPTTSLEEEKEEKVDEIDKKILHALAENSRLKTTEIADEIKLSPDAVIYRINNLKKKGIINFFTCWFNRRLLGYNYYKVLIWLQHSTKEDEERLLNYCIQHPNVVYIDRVLGDWDLEIDIDARDPQELREMLKVLRNRFSGIIRDHTTLTILRDYVINPFKT